MSVINNNLLLTAAAAGGYQVSRSLRFNGTADSSYLSRTPASSGDRKKWTWSAWVKLAALTGGVPLFGIAEAGNDSNYNLIRYANGALRFSTWNTEYRITTAVYRDPSAWYHVVVALDTANATADDRIKIYINGVRETSFSTSYAITQNTDFLINSGSIRHAIGGNIAESKYFDGYMADIWFLDGIAATPSDFAETDATTGQWITKAYAGSKPGNSFHLDFSDNSAATAAALGKDSSGNGLNWTPNNFSVLTGAGNNGNWRNKLSNITYYSGSGITQWDEHLFRGVADNSGYSGYSGFPSDVTWTPATPISYTSSVRFLYDSYPAYTKYTLNGGAEQTTNGSWPPPAGGYQWQTVATGSGTLTSLRFRATSYTADIHAIEVDGVILKDINAAGCDSTVDTPTSVSATDTGIGGEIRGNYCTWNPLAKNSALNLANGNLDDSTGTPGIDGIGLGTIGASVGKFYWELTVNSTSGGNNPIIGVVPTSAGLIEVGSNNANSVGYLQSGSKRINGSTTSYGNSFTTGDIVGVALDLDNGAIYFSKNGTWQNSGVPTSGSSKTGAAHTWTGGSVEMTPAVREYNSSCSANWGQRSFAYTAPSGFKCLCDTSLPLPVIAKSDQAFQTVIWTGDGSSSRAITGLSFSPDLLWVKRRNSALDHFVWDSVRGVTKELYTNQIYAEGTASNKLTSFDTSGFTVQNNSAVNALNDTYVGWVWDAGSTTVTDNTGSTQSSRRTNTSTGLSIVTYSGNATSGATIGHGLGVAPSLIITKSRTAPVSGQGWQVGHASLGWTKRLYLETTNAAMTTAGAWNNTAPTSTVFTAGNSDLVNDTGYTYVAYCFAPVMGLSSFGTYQGNGSTDGPMIWTGHRSRWLMIKRTDTTGWWSIWDTARNTYNAANTNLWANGSDQETTSSGTSYDVDFLANGFKLRNTHADRNASGGTYVYASFSEAPFQYARAR